MAQCYSYVLVCLFILAAINQSQFTKGGEIAPNCDFTHDTLELSIFHFPHLWGQKKKNAFTEVGKDGGWGEVLINISWENLG